MPILPAKNFNIQNSPRAGHCPGFTLLELMIVMGIVAALVAMAIPRLSGQNNQMRGAVRKLSSISRQLQSTAKLKGAVYRLVIDMKEGDKSAEHQFWVEAATARTILTPDEMSDKPLDKYASEDDQPKPIFARDDKVLKGEVALPSGLQFEDVELKRMEQPISSGKAYIHFFPQGLADEAVIHLRGGDKLHWSLIIHPLTGKTDVATERVTLKDLKD